MTRIKPTVSLFRVWQRELDGVLTHFSTTYILYYCGYALTLLWSSCYSSYVTYCDCDICHTIVTLWQSHVILFCALSYSCKSNKKRKEKKRKRNINNNLAVLPSHDNFWLSMLLIRESYYKRDIMITSLKDTEWMLSLAM